MTEGDKVRGGLPGALAVFLLLGGQFLGLKMGLFLPLEQLFFKTLLLKRAHLRVLSLLSHIDKDGNK